MNQKYDKFYNFILNNFIWQLTQMALSDKMFINIW